MPRVNDEAGKWTLYFDRSVGHTLPRVLQLARLPVQNVRYQHEEFPQDAPDDLWLGHVGQLEWVAFTHDRHIAVNEAERCAIQHYGVRCFVLWGAQSTGW